MTTKTETEIETTTSSKKGSKKTNGKATATETVALDKTGRKGAITRRDQWIYDADKLVIVSDPNSEILDELRAKMPVNMKLVGSMLRNGFTTTILCRKNGVDEQGVDIIEVIDGRQRVKAARKANEILAERGINLRMEIPVQFKDASGLAAVEAMVSNNEMATRNSPMTRARNIDQIMNLGGTYEGCMESMDIKSLDTVRQLHQLVKLHPDVQKAVDAKLLPVSVAVKLVVLRREEQMARVEALVAKYQQQKEQSKAAIGSIGDEEDQESGETSTGKGSKKGKKGKKVSKKAKEATEGGSTDGSEEAEGVEGSEVGEEGEDEGGDTVVTSHKSLKQMTTEDLAALVPRQKRRVSLPPTKLDELSELIVKHYEKVPEEKVSERERLALILNVLGWVVGDDPIKNMFVGTGMAVPPQFRDKKTV